MVKLAILWHMHQPYYADPATGVHILPWVRMHAIKDYLGMAALMDEFPGVRVTFNLVPSLLVQLQALADGSARDPHLERGLTPAADLSPEDAASLVANGFHAPVDRLIAPYPRYLELHRRRHAPGSFDADDLRDLQVWHKLAWMDPDRLRQDARLATLVDKGRGYTEDDKQTLRGIERELVGQVIPAYRAAAERGQVELSTSPFYHPILPLLCDTDIHLRAHPAAPRPAQRFARPDDAREQIERAIAFHTDLFGLRPAGMWPSEGAVSDEALQLIAEAGLSWTATDEDILARTLETPLPRDGSGHCGRPDLLYRPYLVGSPERRLACLFRDHALSDRIGFAYQTWDAGAAADDFVARVREAGRRHAETTGAAGAEGEATVAVILDGENAWEHYPGGGRPFLRALYGRLEAADDIQTVTMSEAAAPARSRLPAIFPGSWIQGDFSVWIGHADDRRAWSQLAEARAEYDRLAASVTDEARARARTDLLVAEGSDWCWWYGDDHASDHDRDFDELFRRHLRNVYEALGVPAPQALHVSNITTGGAGGPRLSAGRLAGMTLDGRDSGGLEWLGAVEAGLGPRGTAMHQARGAGRVEAVSIGVTEGALWLRLKGRDLPGAMRSGVIRLALGLSTPVPRVIEVAPDWWAADVTVEVRVPWRDTDLSPGADFAFAILLKGADGAIERVPGGTDWIVRVPGPDANEWSV